VRGEGLACLLQALEVAQQRGLLSLELRSSGGSYALGEASISLALTPLPRGASH
jgi:hypothetical protein